MCANGLFIHRHYHIYGQYFMQNLHNRRVHFRKQVIQYQFWSLFYRIDRNGGGEVIGIPIDQGGFVEV